MQDISIQNQQAIVLRAPGSDRFEHIWCESIDTLMQAHGEQLHQYNEAGADVFFTTGYFAPVESPLEQYKGRKQNNCVAQRSLFLDIDAKVQLIESVQACYKALGNFITSAGLFAPNAVIDSGGGLHVYWICDEDIPLEMWQAMADTLAGAAAHFGLKCDTQCTVDRARILRLPGFINHKYDTKPVVTVAHDDPDFLSLEELAQMLEPHIGLRNQRPSRSAKAAQPQNLFAGLDLSAAMDPTLKGTGSEFTTEKPKSWAKLHDATMRGNGCQVLQWATNNQADVKYPLWTGVLSVIRCTDDEVGAIEATCGQHPDYDLHACMTKAASFDGPRTCAMMHFDAMDSGFATGCSGCPMQGKITSPVIMAYQDFRLPGETVVDRVAETVTTHHEQPDGTTTQVTHVQEVERRALPFPYFRIAGKRGVWQKERVEKEGGGIEWITPEYPLMEEDIGITMLKEGGETGVAAFYEYTHPMQGVQTFSLALSDLTSSRSDTWPAVLANHHVSFLQATTNPLWRANVSKFLQSLAKDYADNFKAADTVEQFGPIEGKEDTFVYGPLCYRATGAPVAVVLSDDAAAWAPKMARPPATQAERAEVDTKVARWNAGLQQTIGDSLVCGPDQFVLMTGFACPLAPFVAPARQRGGLIVPNSTEAGSGKTSMVARAIQLYVAGDEGFMVPNATKMAFLEGKVAMAGALPVCWDELMKGRDERNNALLHELALNSTDRKPRERLTGGSTSNSWQSWFYGTMNPDPHEAISANGGGANGAVARVMNIKVGAQRFGVGAELMAKRQAEGLFDDWCKRNANVVGQKWIEGFMHRLPHLRERFNVWTKRLVEDCPAAFDDGAMRFMTTIVTTTMVATEEAALQGLHPFSVEAVYAYAVTMLGSSVDHATEAVMHDDEIIPAMLNSSLDVMLVVGQASGLPLLDKLPNKEVGIRVEVGAGEWSEVFITVSYVKRWCTEKGLSANKFRQALNVVGTDKSANKRMAVGTNLPSAPTRAYQFKMPSSRFVTAETKQKEI